MTENLPLFIHLHDCRLSGLWSGIGVAGHWPCTLQLLPVIGVEQGLSH
jgi:hypothetical protein